jgi:hypothetical protein
VPAVALPETPDAFASARWEDVAPYYDTLAEAPLDAGTVEAWLAEWSRLEALLGEAGALAMIAYTGDTADPAKEEAYLRFSTDVFPKVDEQSVRLAKRLLDLGWSRADLETTIRRFRRDAEIFREENVPLFAEIEELSAQYQKIAGGLSAEWDGERKTIPQLQPYLKAKDRAVRERAFRVGAAAYLDKRDEMAALFDRMYERRVRVARNAGFADFQQYAFAAKHRFDYTPDDVARFHDAVEATVTPAAERLMAHRKRVLGVDALRPWDTGVDLYRDRPLKPFDTAGEFVAGARRVFDAVDPALGAQFATMADEGLLDLESRQGKAPGGYCTKLPWRGRPFIFMNAVGVPDDVNTLVHEAGHCFHDFAAHRLPYQWQRSTGHEAAELASMSMELLAAPYLARPTATTSRSTPTRRGWSTCATCSPRCRTSPASTRSSGGSTRAARGTTPRRATRRGCASAGASSAASTGRGWSASAWRGGTGSSTSSSCRSTTSSTASRSSARCRCGGARSPTRATRSRATARRSPSAAPARCRDLRRGRARLVFDAETMGELVALVEAHVGGLHDRLGRSCRRSWGSDRGAAGAAG